MATLVTDAELERELLEDRRPKGLDKFDEVWDGIYVLAPLANNEHRDLATGLATVLRITVEWTSLGRVFAGVNVTDQPPETWRENYRCPDVAVFLAGTAAVDRGTHWFGGPDLAIAIAGEGERTREKLDFYARVGTREFLVLDRDPWQLESYRLEGDRLIETGRSTPEDEHVLTSEVVPLCWQLLPDDERPVVRVRHADGKQEWDV